MVISIKKEKINCLFETVDYFIQSFYPEVVVVPCLNWLIAVDENKTWKPAFRCCSHRFRVLCQAQREISFYDFCIKGKSTAVT